MGELVQALGISQPGASKHLRVLREAGLVDVRGDAQRRLYRLRPEPLSEIEAWGRAVPADVERPPGPARAASPSAGRDVMSDRATELTLLDTLDDVGKGARDGAGWHTCLDALSASLAGDREPRQRLESWDSVHTGYRRRFGPRASRIGPPDP